MSSTDRNRQPFDETVIKRLNARYNVHTQARDGESQPQHKLRLSAWAKITKKNTDLALETNQRGFDDGRYNNTHFRPDQPSLTKVTITRDAGVGYSINLALTITVEFEVYSYSQFNEYAKEFLRRDQHNPIKLQWGNISTQSGRGLLDHTLGGMYIVAGGYTTTPSNTFICTFKAIAAAEAIGGFSIFNTGDIVKRFQDPNNKINGQSVGSTSEHEVKGLADIVNLHFLVSGDNSLTDGIDGYQVPNTSPALTPYLKSSMIGKVYTPTPEFDPDNDPTKGNLTGTRKGSKSQKIEYLTLEYIVALLQVGVLDFYNKDQKRSEIAGVDFKIKFDDVDGEQPYSKVPLSLDGKILLFKSCNPREVLFLGAGSGKYQTKEPNPRGKDFEVNLTPDAVAVSIDVSTGTYKILLRNILIRKSLFMDLIMPAISSTPSGSPKSDSNEKDTSNTGVSDRVVTVKEILEKISEAIYKASGGLMGINLSIDGTSQNQVTNDNNEIAANTIRISDRQVITNKSGVSVWEFDPILGDGNLLSFQLKADLPRDLLHLALIQQTIKGAGTANVQASGTTQDNSDAQSESCKKDIVKLRSTDEQTGLWPQFIVNGFSAEKAAAIFEAYRNIGICFSNDQAQKISPEAQDVSGYMPVEMTAEMEGIFPIKIGNLFTSTNLPDHQKLRAGMAGICVQVTDVIEKPGIWTTSIRAIVGAVPRTLPYANQPTSILIQNRLEDLRTSLQQSLNTFQSSILRNDILNRPR